MRSRRSLPLLLSIAQGDEFGIHELRNQRTEKLQEIAISLFARRSHLRVFSILLPSGSSPGKPAAMKSALSWACVQASARIRADNSDD